MIRYTRDNGVAPIISAILLVAITVGMVAVVGVVVVSMTDMGNIPAAGILIEEKQGVVTITHFAGEKLKVGNYYILVDDADRTKDFTGPDLSDGYFGPGDILSWSINSGVLRHVSVVYDGEKGTYLLAEKWFDGISGDGGLSAAFTMTSSTGTSRSELPSVLQAAAADLTGGCPMIVSFSPIESSGDAEYLWTFGNGSTSRESNPSQEYTSIGEYTVTLKVTNKTNGGWNSSSQAIDVRKPGLTAMTWVQWRDYPETLPKSVFYYQGRYSWIYDWKFQVPSWNNWEFNVNATSEAKLRYTIVPMRNVWYHLTGIVDDSNVYFYVNVSGNNVYAGWSNSPPAKLSGSVILDTNMVKTSTESYQVSDQKTINFPLTHEEIKIIYNAEKDDLSYQ